jgi:hypothetical protein
LFGAATIFPLYCYNYVEKRGKLLSKKGKSERIAPEQAQALPWSALWEVIISTPILLPTLLWDDALMVQYGVVIWGLAPYTLSPFQDLVSAVNPFVAFADPVTTTYWIVGGLSGIVHLGNIFLAPYLVPGLTASRIFWPNHGLVVPGPNFLIEGAMIFCQYDYIGISLSVLATGFYIFRADSLSQRSVKRNGYPMLTLIAFIVLGGPGAGLAWLLCGEESLNR